MASSNNSGSASKESWIRYTNMICKCRLVADIKVSMSKQNPNRLYYSCKEKKCQWVGWCEPIEDDDVGNNRVQTNDSFGITGVKEDEFRNLENLVDGMSEGIKEEFATIKFEFDNALFAIKKDVDEKLSVLKKDLEKQLGALKTEIDDGMIAMNKDVYEKLSVLEVEFEAMKKRNGNWKRVISGFVFVMALVFITKFV
jgi:hypothetical protein